MDPSCGEEFWSRTAYDVATLCITVNETKQADRSSRMDRIEKPDGSVTLYVGPDKPEGDETKNWAQTSTARRGSPYRMAILSGISTTEMPTGTASAARSDPQRRAHFRTSRPDGY